MRIIDAIYPKKRLSEPTPSYRVYPYLLKDLKISYPDQVWCSDITYIRMRRGFAYLVAIMDWYSRYVLSWRLSISLDAQFCIEALKEALLVGKPEIFNSDQGSQYTSDDFTSILLSQGILISMDGRGRVFENIFIERLWRTLKYEEVYLKDYADVWEAEDNIGNYFEFYNTERCHSALGYKTPEKVHLKKRDVTSKINMPAEREETKLRNASFLP
jgi:putative transposase